MKKNIAIFLSFIFLACQSVKADMAIGITGAMHMLDASGTETTRNSGEKNTGDHSEDVIVPELFVVFILNQGSYYSIQAKKFVIIVN